MNSICVVTKLQAIFQGCKCKEVKVHNQGAHTYNLIMRIKILIQNKISGHYPRSET